MGSSSPSSVAFRFRLEVVNFLAGSSSSSSSVSSASSSSSFLSRSTYFVCVLPFLSVAGGFAFGVRELPFAFPAELLTLFTCFFGLRSISSQPPFSANRPIAFQAPSPTRCTLNLPRVTRSIPRQSCERETDTFHGGLPTFDGFDASFA